MKDRTVKALFWIIVIAGMALILSGCEPEKVIQQVDVQMTDPCSPLQVATEGAVGALKPLSILISTVPGIPYAATIKTGIAILMAVFTLIQSWRKVKSDAALKEVVIGVNDAKKVMNRTLEIPEVAREILRTSLNESESVATRTKVTKILEELTPITN